MWARERARLVAVARGEAAADRYVRGGLLLNVYTGEIYPANVAIRGERVAYVGLRDDMVGPRTEVIDASGRTLVPGYIEPHAHPWNLATPAALARHVLPLGTTTLFGDNLTVYSYDDLERVIREEDVVVGVLAVPTAAAQEVADDLVEAGVKIIFNYSEALLQVPPEVTVHTSSPAVDLLYALYFYLT